MYEAPEATYAEARKMHRALGIERGVVVQSTAYGLDHQAALDALEEGGGNYRGIGVIDETVSDAELQKLHDAGFRGARFNFYKAVKFAPSLDSFAHSVSRLEEMGWFAKLHLGTGDLFEYDSVFSKLKINVIIDHMGRPDMELGLKDPQRSENRGAAQDRNWWIMLSNGHKQSKQGFPWDDEIPVARAYIEAAPDRVIWGRRLGRTR